MSNALRQPMTLPAFLAWEERQELRFEFDGVQPVAMVGGTAAHAGIQRNLVTALTTRLRGSPCQAFGSDLKIEVAGRIRYPDAFVTCSRLPRDANRVTDPVVVFEILSPSTGGIDRIVKNQEYRDTPSIRRYVMLEPSRQAATVFVRQDGDWVGHVASGDVTLDMPEIGISLPLAELYLDVSLAPETDPD